MRKWGIRVEPGSYRPTALDPSGLLNVTLDVTLDVLGLIAYFSFELSHP